MSPATIEKISGVIAVMLIAVFVLGLAESISTGAAGCCGGFPFWVVGYVVLTLIVYDFWDTCLRKK